MGPYSTGDQGAAWSERQGGPSADHGRRPWVPIAASLACAFIGLLDLVSALTKSQASRLHRLREYVPGGLSHVSTAATLVVGVLLVLLAHGLRRRKRRAFRLTVVLLSASVALHILKGLDVEEALVSLVLLVGLLVVHRDFYARADPRTRWRALGVGLLLLLVSYVLGVCFIALRQDRLASAFNLLTTSRHVLDGLVGLNGPLQFTPDHRGQATADLVGDALLALGAFSGASFLYLLLRPGTPLPRLTDDDERGMRKLLAVHGRRDALGYFSLRRDKSVVWSQTRKACIAYRVVSGVILASGDPLGDPEAWPGAIKAFLELADEHAWAPGVMGCSEAAGTAWTRAGLTALEMGDEAVVEVADFSIEGRAMRKVRQAVARVERAGYVTTVSRVVDLPEDTRLHLRRQAEAWRGAETERGFSMALGRFADPQDPDCVVVMACKEGQLRAFLHFVPWGSDGLSLDLMRRDRTAENGVNELLIVKTLESTPELGIARLSLNFAVFRSALERGERLGAGPVIRGWRGLLLFASRWFQIESLYRFNAKFRPVWEPRFLCFAGAGDLPRVAFAALRAEAFLVLPRPRLPRRGLTPYRTD
ncbi:MAG: putative rane protein with lysine transferase [Frankiales bacterium]|nr:putative rane protein with lysine transferase [Frankiales bacterium]